MKTKTKAPARPVEHAKDLPVAPSAPSVRQATRAQPEPSPQMKAETTPPRQLPTLVEMLRIGDRLNAEEAAQIGNEPLAQAIARLNSLAQQGSEEALKALVQSGNYITRSLFILWAKGDQSQRELLRTVAAKESGFPIPYHPEEVHNHGWKKMVLDLAVGSAGPRKPDANQRSESDAVDAVIDGFIETVEILKKMPGNTSLPDEYRNIPELVSENASSLAKRIVLLWEKSDPGFQILASGNQVTSTWGRRTFEKRKTKSKNRLRKKNAGSVFADDKANLKRAMDEWKLANKQRSDGDVRTDLTEAITSRLRSRLKASPKKSS
jgi:hypothetical protein